MAQNEKPPRPSPSPKLHPPTLTKRSVTNSSRAIPRTRNRAGGAICPEFMGILRNDGELMAKKSRKIRADFRKNRTPRTRLSDWTQKFHQEAFNEESPVFGERIGKGELSRRRTVLTGQAEDAAAGDGLQLEIDQSACRRRRVLSVFGLNSTVEGNDGATHQCATRRLLKTLSTDQRHVVAAGDRVWFRDLRKGGKRI